MLEILSFACQLAWKFVLIGVAFWLFRYIRKNGKDKIIELLQTVGMAIETGCLMLRRALARKLRKESGETTESDGDVNAEGTVV